ncbi:MAG: NFACT family protein [Thermovirgaceae bacterium]|nr:NFACT family protein [Thermovirgaceae bacterium]
MPLPQEVFDSLKYALTVRFRRKQCTKTECGKSWLALFFRSDDQCLFICWHDSYPGFCLATPSEIENLKRTELKTPPFRGIVQKYLERSLLDEISRTRNDRIISMRFSRMIGAGIDTTKTLVVELTGKRSNLHLLLDDGTILESARHASPDGGTPLENQPGDTYWPPRVFEGVDPGKCDDPGLFFSLNRLIGFSRKTGSALKENWHLFPQEKWQEYIRQTIEPGTLANRPTPVLQSLNGVLSAFSIPLGSAFVHEGDTLEVLREYIISPLISERIKSIKQTLLKNMKKRSAKLVSIRKGLENQISQSEKALEYKAAGELLLTYPYRVPKGATSATLPQWRGEEFEDMTIDLDPSKSLSQNAQYYFRKFRKFNVDREELNMKLREIDLEELELSSFSEKIEIIHDFVSLAEITPEILSFSREKTKRISHGPVKIFDYMGHQIIAGSNRKGNRKVTFVFAAGEDLWFHVRGMPGGHVILKSPSDAEPGDIILEFAASLAAHFSKASTASRVQVDYTRRKHVRAIPRSIAEVTYSRARTLTVSPDLWKRLLSKN